MACALWRFQAEPGWWIVKLVVKEIDCCNSIHKEPSCLLTQGVKFIICWSTFKTTALLGKLWLEKVIDVIVNGIRFNIMENEDIC